MSEPRPQRFEVRRHVTCVVRIVKTTDEKLKVIAVKTSNLLKLIVLLRPALQYCPALLQF